MTNSNDIPKQDPKAKLKAVPFPEKKSITMLDQFETIIQIIPLNNGATFACLTSKSRVLVPTSEVGEWTALLVPTLYQE